jgi:RNA polymerase sigma factor (sigma-70 family)
MVAVDGRHEAGGKIVLTYDLVEQRALLRALAPRLSQRERTVLWLRLEHDLTQREIARRVGVSQATIARALHVVARELA